MNLAELEASFQMFVENLGRWIPDGIEDIDLRVLQRMSLLSVGKEKAEEGLPTRYFQVIETPEKITLFNEKFVVWIVPEVVDTIPTTFALVALRKDGDLSLETAYSTTGVYNTSRMVLQILERVLLEIQDTETELAKFS